MRKTISLVFISSMMLQAAYFDNSTERWENDCKNKVVHGCAIAAKYYTRGWYEDANDGKRIVVKGSTKTRKAKALKLMQRACQLDHFYCKQYAYLKKHGKMPKH